MNSPDSSPPGGPAAPPPDPVPAREPTVTEAAALAAAATARRGVVAGGGIESALERVATELLRQQGVERRWRVFFRLAWLGLALAVVGMGFSSQSLPSAPTTPHTALVEVRGEISAETDASAEILVGALKSAFEDQGAQAVVLRINSPGGSPVQAGIVYDEIKRLKAKHNKKVYAVVEEMCASGAYYIAVAADEIYVDKASIVGSIGVLMDGFGFVGLMDKLGVERRLLTSGDNKGMLDPFQPRKPAPDGSGQGHHRTDPPPVHCGGERRPR
jgi:protease-4